jgi:glutamate-1-semialdehyde 2,1-aminomutase
MTWMRMWPGGFPVYHAAASGARLTDVDGHELIDFCLGDTGAMAGHSPAAVQAAVARRYGELGGATTMLPTQDAEWVAAELTRRFGPAYWSFTLTATDANRWAIRLARQVTGRPKIAVFSYCYHGSVDESFIVATPEGPRSREGNVGAPVDPRQTTRVAEFNDPAGLERELAHGDVAAVLMEPALTNIGIVLPEPGYLAAVRELTRQHGTLLINDETHTFSAGPGGCTAAWGLEPDIVTIGKSIAGGIPAGAYGLGSGLADRILADPAADIEDTGGVGGTLAGNALSVAAMRATLEEVLTDQAFDRMISVATRFAGGVQGVIDRCGLPWNIVQLGARAEYRFCPDPPRTGGESHAAADPELDEYLHLYMINRGILITPFHNMALMCPATTEADADAHTAAFAAAADDLLGLSEVEEHDAGHDQHGGGDAGAAERLAEDERADDRAEDDAGLAERGDRRQRAPGLRPQHQPVGQHAERPAGHAGQQDPRRLLQQHLPPPEEGEHRDAQALQQYQPPDVADRAGRQPHPHPVHRGVGGNGQAGADGGHEGRASWPAAREDERGQAGRDDEHAGHLGQRGPLVHEDRRQDGHHQRRRAAGQRIDLAELAVPVAPHQQQVVEHVDRYRSEQVRPAAVPGRRGDDDQRDRGEDAAHADQREGQRLVLDAVRDGVPGRVGDGGGEHCQRDGRREGGRRVQRGSPGRCEQEPSGLLSRQVYPGRKAARSRRRSVQSRPP